MRRRAWGVLDESKVNQAVGHDYTGAVVEHRRLAGAHISRIMHPPGQRIGAHGHDWPVLTLYRMGGYRERADDGAIELDGPSVVFQPVEGVAPERPIAYADAKADGTFQLRTEHGEGAPAGDYKVLIMWYGSATGEVLDAKSKLPAKYADPENPLLKATIKAEPNELETFALN